MIVIAKAIVKMPEEFLLKISRLESKTDDIVPKVLEAGGNVVLQKVKSNLQVVIGKSTKRRSKSTGELLRSIGLSQARQDRNGDHNVKVGFAEQRSDGGSNAKLANILEYGKHGQPERPFLKPAKSSSKKACEQAMIAKLEEELRQI